MRKISLIILFLFGITKFYTQDNRFVYEYRFIPDSTQLENRTSEVMFLDIRQNASEFYSYKKFRSDSLMAEDMKKGLASPPPIEEFVNYRIIKNSKGTESITSLSSNLYIIKYKRPVPWKLHPQYTTVLNHKVQKATAEYAGRLWEAWFAPDIPIQDGPYLFRGLPGLILKVKDLTGSHDFELIAIRNLQKSTEYPFIKNFAQKFEVSRNQYAKIFKNYREDPAADLVGKIPDYRDAEGNMVSGQQKVREIGKMMKDKLKADNNILELDLLK
ncbi:GLPGLI family protein [Chryseobacterium hagamense]|uniref:GLPGLI family protein n=1 Tax=Chryseobacterium hagamense TaxID=395935 RepID=A0A511YS56_9FLAO|nr:GLPGLI family protein [Chryseobacterium hagamense]GEN78025.1 hypothetical protein CHA01nite_37650 [Chryseobacterium hagamense]